MLIIKVYARNEGIFGNINEAIARQLKPVLKNQEYLIIHIDSRTPASTKTLVEVHNSNSYSQSGWAINQALKSYDCVIILV